jgi:hypothetical protein
VDDLAAPRFAVSPLAETVFGLQLLRTGEANMVNGSWLRWVRHDLSRHPLALPLLWPLLPGRRRARPEFLTPAPAGRAPSFAGEVERMLATTPDQVRASLERVFGHPDSGSWPGSAVELAARPSQTLELIAEELTSAHARLIAPHWDRMRGIIEADVAYQGAVLARSGAAVLFAGLHAGVRWAPGKVTVTRYGPGPHEYWVTPGPVGGLVLVPSVLIWPDTTVKAYSSSQTTLRYPARGTAAAWPQGPTPKRAQPGGSATCLARPGRDCWKSSAARPAPPRSPAGCASPPRPFPSTSPSCAAAASSTAPAAAARCSIKPATSA